MSGKSRRILIIDNNAQGIEVMSLALQAAGYAVLTSRSGQAGWLMAGKHRPDLILLDLHLDDMRGGEVYRKLKDDPATASIPIIICTVQRMDEIERELKGMPCLTLYKPFSLAQLRAAVEQALTPAS